jgi:hypothetical protein
MKAQSRWERGKVRATKKPSRQNANGTPARKFVSQIAEVLSSGTLGSFTSGTGTGHCI